MKAEVADLFCTATKGSSVSSPLEYCCQRQTIVPSNGSRDLNQNTTRAVIAPNTVDMIAGAIVAATLELASGANAATI